jgi:anti-sigma B factor antagonist
MSLKLRERQIGDVTIVDLGGRMTLGTDSSDFSDLIGRLLPAGKTKIILNMSDVMSLDSLGVSVIASTSMRASRAGGALKLLAPSVRLRDLFKIMRFDRLFEVFDDEEMALRSFAPEMPVRHCRCPVCQTRMSPASPGGVHWERQMCPSCGARVQVGHVAGSGNAVRVMEVEVPTYEAEYFHVTCDRPVTVSVVGRLDSFAWSTLVGLWSAIPSPKRVLFHLDERAEISASGWTKLMALVGATDGADRAAVLLDSVDRLPEELRWSFAETPGVSAQRTTAISALGETDADAPWLTDVE